MNDIERQRRIRAEAEAGVLDPEPDDRDMEAWLRWAARGRVRPLRFNFLNREPDDITRRLCARLGIQVVSRSGVSRNGERDT